MKEFIEMPIDAKDPEELGEKLKKELDELFNMSRQNPQDFAASEHYISMTLPDPRAAQEKRELLVKFDFSSIPYQFWYNDARCLPAMSAVKRTIAEFLWDHSGEEQQAKYHHDYSAWLASGDLSKQFHDYFELIRGQKMSDTYSGEASLRLKDKEQIRKDLIDAIEKDAWNRFRLPEISVEQQKESVAKSWTSMWSKPGAAKEESKQEAKQISHHRLGKHESDH